MDFTLWMEEVHEKPGRVPFSITVSQASPVSGQLSLLSANIRCISRWMNYVVFTGIKELLKIKNFFTIAKKRKVFFFKYHYFWGFCKGWYKLLRILTFICMIYLMFRGKNKKVRVASIRLQKPEKLLAVCWQTMKKNQVSSQQSLYQK